MQEQQQSTIGQNPHRKLDVGDAEALSCPRLEAVRELMADERICSTVGAAWRLWIRLILVEGGSMAGTQEELGQKLGVSGRTVNSWTSILEKAGVVEKKVKNKRVEINLVGRHLEAATAPDTVAVGQAVETTAPESARLRALKKALEASEEGGSKLEVSMVI